MRGYGVDPSPAIAGIDADVKARPIERRRGGQKVQLIIERLSFAKGANGWLESTPAVLPFYQARAGLDFTLAIRL